jgi:4-amino-4-deoxy-L-arabinose transferase-like glycosyltransferase
VTTARSREAWAVAVATVGIHLATATIYTYHRDEVYYLASGRRLAWGYVDHPPLTPFLYRVSDALFGSSVFGLRIVPALLHGLIVLLTARLAAELGGNNRAQMIAALGAAVAPMFLTIGHFLTTVTMEVVLWTATTILVVRLLKGADPRLWLAVGLVLGLAMLDKWTTVLLVAGLGAGLLLVPERRILATPWVAAGAILAAALWLPNLLWQADRGFPQFDVAGNLRNYLESTLTAPFQFVLLGVASVVLVVPGLFWLLRDPAAQRFRCLAFAFVVIVAVVMVSGGKPYYAAVFAPVLIAAGAASGIGSTGWQVPAWLVGIGLLIAPFALPLLPVSTADAVRGANKEIGEMVGWPHLVDVVQGVYRQHPGATIFTGNYSEAGILELLGPARGLPQPISGHNSYWYWGHPKGRSPVTIVVGVNRAYLEPRFGDVQLAAVFHTPGGVHNMEDGAQIWVCRDQKPDWDQLWPQLRHFQ